MSAQQYARMAQTHWQTYLPEATAKLPDPEKFFQDLGRRVEGLVQARAEALIAAADPRPTTEQEKIDQGLMAYRTAEEEVLADEVFRAPEKDAMENELPMEGDEETETPPTPETPEE